MHKKEGVLILFLFICINSCKTDFNTIAPYKEITVVYGLLDPDTVPYQYIKINKAFLGEGNALVMAQQKDSANYPPGSLDVKLQQLYFGQVVATIQLDTTTSIPKDPGLFSNPYQVLYRTPLHTQLATDGSTYNLLIYNKNDQKTLSSSTPLVSILTDALISRPGLHESINFGGANGGTYSVMFTSVLNARLYSLVINFHYGEKNLNSPYDSTAKVLNWVIGTIKSSLLTGGENLAFTFNKADFYNFIASQIPFNPNFRRYFSSVNQLDFVITYAGDDLSTYIDVNQPSLGIVQQVPEYTNINGGIGILSSRSTRTLTRSMDIASQDSLLVGQVTGGIFQQ